MSSVNDSPLISVSELNSLLNRENVKIFDVRGKWGSPPESYVSEYEQGHIPNAVYLDWTRHFLAQDISIGLAPVASESQALQDFRNLGISEGDTIVLYDDYHHMLASRIWWAMRYWGFTQVRILDGGWRNWVQSDLPISTEKPGVKIGNFMPNKQPSLRVSTEQVKDRHESTDLLDARGPINYAGQPDDPRTGHIPGAINIPYSSLLDAQTGQFKDKETLQKMLSDHLSLNGDVHFISSCGSGYAGAVLLVALALLGIEAPLYDGSFSEWKNTPDLPIEQGAAAFSVK